MGGNSQFQAATSLNFGKELSYILEVGLASRQVLGTVEQ
jgi:hypothetical protein